MGVVELDGDLVGEFLPRALALLETSDNVVERGGAPEVLLLQAKLLTTVEAIQVSYVLDDMQRHSLVVRVENRRDGLSTLLIGHGALVVSRVEFLKVKLATSGLAGPETEVVASARLVSRNGYVKGNSLDNLSTLPRALLLALVILPAVDLAVELNVNYNVMALELPWVEVQPVVGNFDLVSVDNLLLKDTVAVAQAVTPGRVVERGH